MVPMGECSYRFDSKPQMGIQLSKQNGTATFKCVGSLQLEARAYAELAVKSCIVELSVDKSTEEVVKCATKRCVACASEIATEASRCPYCRARQVSMHRGH